MYVLYIDESGNESDPSDRHFVLAELAVSDDPAMEGAVAFLVSAEPPEKTVRVNITARESQIATIDRLAKARGMTRSAYMVQSAVQVGVRHKLARHSSGPR